MAKPAEAYETYEKVRLLGEGSFGKAYLVKAKSDGVGLFHTSHSASLNKSMSREWANKRRMIPSRKPKF